MTFIIINDIFILNSLSKDQNPITTSFTTTKAMFLRPLLFVKCLYLTKY